MGAKHLCKNCGSNNIVFNGKRSNGRQKYQCKHCRCYRTFGPDYYYTDQRKEEILRAYQERASLRGVRRIYGVSTTTVLGWLKKKSQGSRPSQPHSYPHASTTLSSMTSSGHLSRANSSGRGCGLRSVDAHESSRTTLVDAHARTSQPSMNECRPPTRAAPAIATDFTRTTVSRRTITRAGRKNPGAPRVSKDSTTSSGNA